MHGISQLLGAHSRLPPKSIPIRVFPSKMKMFQVVSFNSSNPPFGATFYNDYAHQISILFLLFRIIVNAVITHEVGAALDRTNISDRKAAHVFEKHFKLDVEKLIVSQNTIRPVQIKHREAFAAEVKVAFKPLILHWDGKIMENAQVLEKSDSTAYPLLSLDKTLLNCYLYQNSMIAQQLQLQIRFPRQLMTRNYGTELRVSVLTPQL